MSNSLLFFGNYSDILHPGRANVSKEELREKLSDLYKSNKDQVSVFGLRTHYGGGKTTGFALIYDSSEAMKKFEPLYRLVRVGQGEKPERASRQQRTSQPFQILRMEWLHFLLSFFFFLIRDKAADSGSRSFLLQASNGRTGRRSSEVRQRPRVERRTRRSKLFVGLGVVSSFVANVTPLLDLVSAETSGASTTDDDYDVCYDRYRPCIQAASSMHVVGLIIIFPLCAKVFEHLAIKYYSILYLF